MPNIKGLVLWEPWATLLVHGIKTVETRHWATPYRGPIAIIAGKHWTDDERAFCDDPEVAADLAKCGVTEPEKDFHFGCAVGIVDMVDCLPTSNHTYKTKRLEDKKRYWDLSDEDIAYGNFAPGRFGWVMSGGRWFAEPVPMRGTQGLFTIMDRPLITLLDKQEGHFWTRSLEP
jgi:hypothetical protein